jgi:predicted ATPase/transcriptional regulator with GAF, ATPase, and Fis domain
LADTPPQQRPSSEAGPPSLPQFFDIAIRLCHALDELHRRGAVHGGLTPTCLRPDPAGLLLDLPGGDRSEGAQAAAVPHRHDAAAYMSPEQTGRINRAVDYRTDFYSLGATLYELATGTPPFELHDPLELIHAHIAKTPVSPAQLRPDLPEPVAAIIQKLLAKEAADRYQSAAGLRDDLERCRDAWTATHDVPAFPLGQFDVSDRFLIPQRLYGRDREVGQLLSALDEACAGANVLALVAGYSGVGKTSLIRELHRPIVDRRGYFISGKVDQVVRSIPYGAIIQAFRGLVSQVLTESEERLAAWRERLAAALGGNGGVIAEVLPEIELVLGAQPAPPPLDPAEAQNRFQYVLQNFVRTLARADQPLVVFLDDIQWMDAASLDLLRALAVSGDIHHLLFVCAYRDHDVSASHPLTRAIASIEAGGSRVVRVELPPLRMAGLVPFLCDTLRCEPPEVEALAQLTLQKTDGNPFFVIQFLKSLQHDGLFSFDHSRRRWAFRLDAIAKAATTENVVDLMTRKIQWLSPGAQGALTLAACIGNRFDRATFLTVSQLAPADADAGLREACDAGLILRTGESFEAGREPRTADAAGFMFLHDQVQQAAYGLIPPDRRRSVHLDVGRLLLADSRGEPADDRLFEIVNHLNIGRDLIVQDTERLAAERLNLRAGRKAKTSAAYRAAGEYFDAGIALVRDADWQTAYDLTFSLHVEAAECRYLSGDFAGAEVEFARLLPRAATRRHEALVHELWMTLHENQSRWHDAVKSGRDGLAGLGIVLPEGEEATAAALEREVAHTHEALGACDIASLVDLPLMTDPDTRTIMRMLTTLWSSAYISGNQLLARLISATLVRLSLAHGNTEDSAYGYVTHAITVGPVRGDYRSAYEWGELALRVNERFGDARRRAKIHQQFQAHVNLWRRPFATCIPLAREAYRSGLETGDFAYAGYGAATEAWSAWLVTRNLDQFLRDYTPHLEILGKLRMRDFQAAHRVLLNWARALQGRTAGPLSLADETFDEHAYVAAYEDAAPFFLTFYYVAKLHLHVIAGDLKTALAAAARARAVTVHGTIWPVLLDFWGALAAGGLYDEAGEADRRDYHARLVTARDALGALAEQCPENFRAYWLLLAAEVQRIAGHAADATRLCEDAVAFARVTGFVQLEALAAERCASLWLARGHERVAAGFLRQAHRGYADWGATIKVEQLERVHGPLLDLRAAAVPTPLSSGGEARVPAAPASLDTATVLKVAHAIAREIELDGLLRRLIELAVENAGAQRGVFLEQQGGALVVQAEADADPARVTVRQAIPLDRAERLSTRVVRFVQRTGQDVVLGHAAADERFAGDPHIERNAVKSILCVPIAQQGRPGGVLYLENNLTTGAFTPARLEILRVLAAQAAISLENARLYEGLRAEVDRRTTAEVALRSAMAELETLKDRLEVENVYLQEEIRTQHNFEEIVGNSPALLEALRKVERVAPTESTVLILGETGSGKELFARAVHSRSRRGRRPLVKVNCGAIAPGLVESELFGHVKGAFTGALEARVGRFEVANGGTIFLDEVGELPLDAQVKLLRVLQEQEFEPVGSNRTVRVDIRVIAATNRDLEHAVREGRFRADLLYRLNVFPIQVPALRDRRSDVRLLVGFLAAALSRKLGKPIHGFSARSMDWILRYDWPGNVRELQNVVERAAILAHSPVLEVDRAVLGTAAIDVAAAGTAAELAVRSLDDVQRLHIINVLKSTGGVVEGGQGAATVLGLHPNTLRSRIKKLGIPPSIYRPRPQ